MNYFENLKPKVIIAFIKNLLRSESFVKQRFFISDGEILYKPLFGGLIMEEYNDIFLFFKKYNTPNI